MEVMQNKRPMAFMAEQPVSANIPFCHHVTDHIVSMDNGELVTTFRIEGRTHLSASDDELIKWVNDLSLRLKQVGTEHVDFWIHMHHKILKSPDFSGGGGYFAQRLQEKYAQRFENSPLMANDYYLSIVYNPVGDATQKALAAVEKMTPQERVEQRRESIAALEDIASQLEAGMQPYRPVRLGVYYMDAQGNIEAPGAASHVAPEPAEGDEDEDEDDLFAELAKAEPEDGQAPVGKMHAYSSALEFYGFLINGEWEKMPVCRGMAKHYLPANRVVSSPWGDVMQVRSEERSFFMAGIELREIDDEETEPGQLNPFLSAPFEFVLTQSFCCMSQHAAKSFFKKSWEQLEETKDLSQSQIVELRQAADGAASSRFVTGWHHCTVHVFGESMKEATRRSRATRSLFADCGIRAAPIGLASEAGYFAMLPGNRAFAPRRAVLTSHNLLSLTSFHNVHSGKPEGNPWGSALMMLESSSGSPFYFNFHSTPRNEDWFGKRPNGHTIILGKSGAGKTTLLNAMVAMATKYRPRIFMFDRDRGMQQMVMALGGMYRVIHEGQPSGFQPLQLEPNKLNLSFVKRLVRTLCEISLNGKLGNQEKAEINQAVEAVMGEDSYFAVEDRTLTQVRGHLPAPAVMGDETTLASLLAPWCRGGEYGWLFDNDHDDLSMEGKDIVGFDITDFLVEKGEPALDTRSPMLMYLLFRMRKAVDGKRRTIKVFDEFSTYLDDPIMDVEIKRGLKTDRKRDVVYVFSTQEPNDALDSRIGKTVNQQVATKVLLENPEADRTDYVNRMKLTPMEYEAVLNIPEGSRQFLVKQGTMAAMAKLDLSGMDKEISILSGTPDGADRAEQIVERLGTDDPETWLKAYWGEE